MKGELRLKDLNEEIIEMIIDLLPPKELLNFNQLNRYWNQFTNNEIYWKKLCLTQFPWLFWSGQCESTLSFINNGPRLYQSKDKLTNQQINHRQIDANTTIQMLIDSDYGPLCDKDLGKRCGKECIQQGENPFHPLPKSWKSSLSKIFNGKYTGLIFVLDSLDNREMSACKTLVTYDKSTHSFHCCYETFQIYLYQQGQNISISTTNELTNEVISLNDRTRFRRIPLDLLPTDPRELYTRSLFTTPLTDDGRPAFYIGQEVEIQWRTSILEGYLWWKGIVRNNYMHAGLTRAVDSGVSIPNIPSDDETDFSYILVEFPQYPEESPWRYVHVSPFGVEEFLEGLGYVGGIRPINCLCHKMLWKLRFPRAVLNLQ
ncbi:hypothetical protein BC833DRAFT_603156 [Globomyces pollinis-pini]|nr:hypothetical protein BC833DRAFT_603156 [Globomyces pollinis-pini]